MKMNILHSKLFLIPAFAACLSACNDFDGISEGYDTERDKPFIPSPPTIDPSWNLLLLDNIGQHDPNVYVYKDKKYDGLFTRTLGWNGGDGVLTTELPDGNLFWSFNDSFYGVVDGETRTRYSSNFPRNSIMIQKGGPGGLGETDSDLVWLADWIQTTDPDADYYYQARTHIRAPEAGLSAEQIQAGEIDNDYVYWAGDGTIFNHPNYGKILQLLWISVDLTGGDGSMKNYDKCLVEYSLQGTPGDDQYMSILTERHHFLADTVGYGSTLCEGDDGHVYLYTTEQSGFDSQTLVARTETYDLGSPWSYYIRDLDGEFKWQTTFPDPTERARSYIQTQAGSMPWVFKSGDYYYMTFQSFPFGRAIYICRSEKPYGPFAEHKLLFTLPETLDKLGDPYPNHWYMINLHTGLSREGELVFSTNSDPVNFWDQFNYPGSADYYRPYFFRIYNWQSLFAEEDTEEEDE